MTRHRGRCGVCHHEGDVASTDGLSTLAICGQCAQRHLPALLAEAVDYPATRQRVAEVWRDAERHYMRAMAERLWIEDSARRPA